MAISASGCSLDKFGQKTLRLGVVACRTLYLRNHFRSKLRRRLSRFKFANKWNKLSCLSLQELRDLPQQVNRWSLTAALNIDD